MKHVNKDHVCGFLFGLTLGGSCALLFAPRSGKTTRKHLAKAASDGVEQARGYGEAVRDSTRGIVAKGKEALTRHKDEIASVATH